MSTFSHRGILGALLKKELRLYSRNKIYLFLTALTLVFFAIIFWVVPNTVDESITLAVAPPIRTMLTEGQEALLRLGIPREQLQQLEQADLAQEEGLNLVELQDEEQLRQVISGALEVYRDSEGTIILRDRAAGAARPRGAERVHPHIGIAFPSNFIFDTVRGEKTTVRVIADAAVPAELRHAMQSFVRELAYQLAGQQLPVELPDEETIILGPDRMGAQASLRDKLRPLMALMLLVVETYAMASLISVEVMQRTVTALLVTPMRIGHFLVAKSLFGTAMAFIQGVIILLLVGGFTLSNWSLLLVTMLVGAILFTAVAMLIGAAGKDFIDQLMYAVLFTVPLMIPAFSVLFPGTAATWIRLLPSYPVIRLIVGATLYDATWAHSLGALAAALAWVAVLYGAGLLVLKRKVESL